MHAVHLDSFTPGLPLSVFWLLPLWVIPPSLFLFLFLSSPTLYFSQCFSCDLCKAALHFLSLSPLPCFSISVLATAPVRHQRTSFIFEFLPNISLSCTLSHWGGRRIQLTFKLVHYTETAESFSIRTESIIINTRDFNASDLNR